MTYDGKTTDEMSFEELENALIYCYAHMKDAQSVFELNQAAIVEISEEMQRREQGGPKLLN